MRSVRHPVGQQHRLIFREVAVVKHQQELRSVRIQPLNRMRNTRRKIPEIPFGYVRNKALALEIKPRNARVPIKHECPLCSRVPVQFANSSRGQPHIHARNRLRDRQFAQRHLPRPSSFLHSFMREPKGILKRLHAPCVRLRREKRIWILRIDLRIARPRRARTSIVFRRIRLLLLPLRFRR